MRSQNNTFTLHYAISKLRRGGIVVVSFVFRAADNGAAGLLFDAPGQIDGEDLVVMVNHGTDVTRLVADFAHTGTGATAAGVPQVTRLTANDFSSPVVYTVSATDGSTRDFTVTVSVTPGRRGYLIYLCKCH
jgi:hypothetical protein